ncbi:MAG: MAPEG family protein, partial [Methylococcales bacterium]
SSFEAALLALLLVWLSLRVIKVRRAKRVRLGDGGEHELQVAIRAQGNATEYIPISVILLVLLELNGAHMALLHISGVAILTGRLIHARGLITESIPTRVLGMQVTLFTLIAMALANIGYSLAAAIGF